MAWTPRAAAVALALLPAAALAGCGNAGTTAPHIPPAIHRIRHVIVVMQENRSFDNYFGTYPGADGIPLSWDHASIGPAGITWSFGPYELGGYVSAGDATVSWADLKRYLRRDLPFAIRSIRPRPDNNGG